MRPAQEWRIHVGAHKTATTHVQDTLRAHKNAMAGQGVDYICREEFGPLQRKYAKPENWRRRFWSAPLAYAFKRQVNRLRAGPETVLLSDEDLLGYSDDLLSRNFYPAVRGAHLIRALSEDAPVCLFLAVRSYDQILPSAYAQILKTYPARPDWRGRVSEDVMRTPPSWVELLERLMALFPDASFCIWTQEDYRTHWQGILSRLAGRDVGQFPDLAPPARTASPSHDAICKAEVLIEPLSFSERRARVRKMYDALSAGDDLAAYRPYSHKTAEGLRDRYRQDLQRIEQYYPGILFRPPGSPEV